MLDRGEVFVVIRAAGERTAGVCRSLIEEDVRPESVVVINERPFEKALRRSYELGIESAAHWLVTIDADLLLRRGAVREMVSLGHALPDEVFMAQPWTLDKLFGSYRRAGPRLYRASLLRKALALVPDDGERIRPESATIQEMRARGYSSKILNIAVGLHDYEQYYRDVYRKCFVHGLKHLKWPVRVLRAWRCRSHEDLDYWVALHGFWAGLMSDGSVRLDIDFFPKSVEDILAPVQAEEKSAMREGEIGPDYIEARLTEAGPLPLRPTPREQLRQARDRLGWTRLTPWVIGKGLSRLGGILQRSAGREFVG